MKGIIWGLIRETIRNPWALIAMYALTILFVFMIGQTDMSGSISIPVYSEELSESEVDDAVAILNADQTIDFYSINQGEVQDVLNRQSAEVAVHLQSNRYDLLVARESFATDIVESAVNTYYVKEQFVNEAVAAGVGSASEIRDEIGNTSEAYPISTTSFTVQHTENWTYDQSLQAVFGFSLFFVIYTITFSVTSIIEQKQNGVWDRLILSPASKTSIYLGNLIYSFLVGYLQIFIIFILFATVFQFDFQGGFLLSLIVVIPFIFSLVSLGILLSGIVTSMRQLDAIVPFIAVSFAMLGGAFWPIEIVSSKAILILSKISPITYGMEMLKGATLYNWSFEQFLLPASILFFIGALCMGVGLNLIERRSTT
ncbi:ABC transporter permease [Alkalicoccobacillus murimartini]|uniref:ABC-2 type transport system permease protein n=1 Tax=Alkalicoccobacillus murimartini TaxID=171685 RepID=A0ABT9YKF4_9BACI|nr:ABC transporter permease [Alkalicoccobacillus murimartini]MDQ0208345.1 ABC-2 type transport system permease protein [Alkalicoccobacillus murimartini]